MFQAKLKDYGLKPLPVSVETMQLNITRLCNQSCVHCHVDASPSRNEHMSREVIYQCLDILEKHDTINNVDITGGAPELNPHFDYLVTEAKRLKKHVMVRHNLTVIFDGNPQTGESKSYLPEFFAENKVEVIASLPFYEEKRTDEQRGTGVFKKSLMGLNQLNSLGYGKEGSELILTLVHNPGGSTLPANQIHLEAEFKHELLARYGLVFNQLYTITNMPINRFLTQLIKSGTHNGYLDYLANNFNPSAAEEVMCRSLISVGIDGKIYDCDFNQMLEIPVKTAGPVSVFNFNLGIIINRDIQFNDHCFGCTAGGGSSCSGSTTSHNVSCS